MKIQIKKDNRMLDNLIWLFTVLYLVLVCVLSTDSTGSIVMFGCAGAVFLLSAIKTRGKVQIRVSRYHLYCLTFGVYALMSALWAMTPGRAQEQAFTILKLLLCMALMYIYYQQETNIWRLYDAIRWSGFAVSVYTILHVGVSAMAAVLLSGKRLEVYFSNINSVGIMAAFAVVITFYELFFQRVNVLALLMLIPCAFVIAASGTRKAVLIILMGCCILLYYRYKSKNALKTAMRILVIGMIVILAISVISSLPMFSGITERMDGFLALLTGEGKVDNSTYVRNLMVQVGLEEFAKRPLFGIGIGSSGTVLGQAIGTSTYFHNNYVELLCCGGIVGFAIYYSLFAYCLWNLFKYRNTSDSLIKLGLTLVIVFLAMDMARVTYYSKPTFFYTMVFYLHVESLKHTVATNETNKTD